MQVNQSAFKVNEAAKKLAMVEKNLEKALENLHYATLGFEEGVIPTSNVVEAHTRHGFLPNRKRLMYKSTSN